MLLANAVEGAALVDDVFERPSAELAVLILLVVGLDVEVDGAVRLIGKAVVDNLLHQLLLLDDVTGGVRLDARAQHIERIHGLMVAVGVILRYLHRLELLQARLLLNLVVALVCIVFQMSHVGNVPDVAHLVAQMLQVAEENVEGDGRAGVSEMRIAVDGGTADVHSHVGSVQRHEAFLLPVQRIINQ